MLERPKASDDLHRSSSIARLHTASRRFGWLADRWASSPTGSSSSSARARPRVLRHCRALVVATRGFCWRHRPPGRYPFNAGHFTAPGALSHGSSTCLACPCLPLDRESPWGRVQAPPPLSVYKKMAKLPLERFRFIFRHS